MLTVRQYFDSNDPVETEIRSRVTQMWEEVDWYWYLRRSDPGYEDNEYLYWHWSPDYGWAMNMKIFGNNECMIAYLLAVASPTHPIPASCYHNGWANPAAGYPYENGNIYYGYKQWVGEPYGGPLFFTHFSFLGFDPRNKSDDYCNYFDNSRNISLINRAHCANNPNNFKGYSNLVWGLTASFDPWGFLAHSPTVDNGTITPTAAISAMPYVPDESIATLKHLYHTYGDDLWGPFGFHDAFNLEESNWFSNTFLAVDEGPIVVMIENYRTQLLWDLFMANPEIGPMLEAIGWQIGLREPEDPSGIVNGLDYEYFKDTWNKLPNFDALTPAAEGTVDNFDTTPRDRNDFFAFRFTGYIEVPANGGYTFYTNSDDGSQLYIGDTLVVDNDGLHGMQERSGFISLKAGKHAITVIFFEKDGAEDLIVSYAAQGIPKTQIPNSVLYRAAE